MWPWPWRSKPGKTKKMAGTRSSWSTGSAPSSWSSQPSSNETTKDLAGRSAQPSIAAARMFEGDGGEASVQQPCQLVLEGLLTRGAVVREHGGRYLGRRIRGRAPDGRGAAGAASAGIITQRYEEVAEMARGWSGIHRRTVEQADQLALVEAHAPAAPFEGLTGRWAGAVAAGLVSPGGRRRARRSRRRTAPVAPGPWPHRGPRGVGRRPDGRWSGRARPAVHD